MELEEGFRKLARTSGGCSAGGPDRLSSLPDCLLHTIMSFLKARQAVQTCVLSTRWRHLWRSVPCLDIDFDEFSKAAPASDDNSGSGGNSGLWRSLPRLHTDFDEFNNMLRASDDKSGSGGDKNFVFVSGGEGSCGFDVDDEDSSSFDDDDDNLSGGNDGSGSDQDRYNGNDDYDNHKDWEHFTKYKDWEDFEDFAVKLMHCCNIAQLDSLRLHIAGSGVPEFGKKQAAGWLRRALKYCIPDRASQYWGLSSGSWLLKRLHLCHVLLDNGFVKLITSVCRSLEDLELDDCSCEKIQSVTSHSLKTLVLRNCRWHDLSEIISPTLKILVIDGGWNDNDCELVIFAPAVAYLHLAVKVHQFPGGVSLNELPSIAMASIHLQGHKADLLGSELVGDQFELLSSISNSTNLKLSGVGTRVLGDGKTPRFQEFKNLRNLLLENCDLSDDFKILAFFLRCSPILEKLTLRLCKFPKYSTIKKRTPKLNKTSGLFGSIPARQRAGQASTSIPGAQNRMPGEAPCARQPSSELRGLDLMCENLKAEIIYKYDYGHHLMQLLLRVSVNLQKDNIKLTEVK